jgi:hypothetical protein
LRRRLALALAALTTSACVSAALTVPSVADAATGPAIAGTATPVAAAPGGLVTMSYSITTDSAYTAASVVAVPSTSLTFVPGSVTVDAVPQPAITSAAGALTVPTPDEPAVATHVVTFEVTTSTTAQVATVSAAAFRYTDTAHLTGNTINAAPVLVNPPDLSIAVGPTGAPTDLKLGRGDAGDLGLAVSNHGAATPVTLSVTVPAGLVLIANVIGVDDTEVTCTASLAAPGQVSCSLGLVRPGTQLLLDVPLTTTASAAVGQNGAIGFAVTPTDPAITDATLSDNTVAVPFAIIASPHIVSTISTSKTKVTVGQKQTLTLTVHNDGPGTVDAGLGLVALENEHFAITAFDGKAPTGSSAAGALEKSASMTTLGHATEVGNLATSIAAKAITQAAIPSATDQPDERLWDLGSLAPGQSIVAHLTVRAVSAGAMQLAIVPITSPGDPTCDLTGDDFPTCAGLVSLRAVAAVVAPAAPIAPVVHHSTPVATTPSLAATGSPSTLATLLALAMLLAGAAAIRLGRRRA